MKLTALLWTLVFAGVVVVACGDSSDNTSGAGPVDAAAPTTDGPDQGTNDGSGPMPGARDAESDSAPSCPPVPDASADGGDAGPQPCPNTAFDPALLPYKSPTVRPGACTEKVFDALFRADKLTFPELKEAIAKEDSQACADCVFAPDNGPTWAPVLETCTGYVVNRSGCIALRSKKDSCGKAYEQWRQCVAQACGFCTTDIKRAACLNQVQDDGVCKAVTAAVNHECDGKVNDYIDSCLPPGGGPLDEPVRSQCIVPK